MQHRFITKLPYQNSAIPTFYLYLTSDAKRSFNSRELKAIWIGFLWFQEEIRDQNVQILCDNATAIAYVAKQGGTNSRVLLTLAREILSWAEENLASLSTSEGQFELDDRLPEQEENLRIGVESKF